LRLKAALKSYEILHNRFKRQRKMTQAEVDNLAKSRQQFSEEIPKSLNELTQKQIYLYLLNEGKALSAEEVAEGIGLARVTARRYLDYLEKTGKVILGVQYGSIGRPVNRYKVRE
jgi:two-component system response regulator DctR